MNLSNSITKIQWITLPAAQRRLGLSRETMVGFIKAGTLKGRLCGGCRWFITANSVMRFQRWLERARAA